MPSTKQMDAMAAALSQKDAQLDLSARRAKQLGEDKKALTEEVALHKWEHALTKSKLTRTTGKLDDALKEIANLKEGLRVAKLPQNSSNSSKAPSTDFYKPKRNKNYSLRGKTNRKPGGQPGHKGVTLEFCKDEADHEMFYEVESCTACGNDLSGVEEETAQTHQVVDIVVPKKKITNHTAITKRCRCGQYNRAGFPAGAKGPVNYGNGLRALVANLSVCQYMPYKRTSEFIGDLFGIDMSEGTIKNLLTQFTGSAQKKYEDIRQQVFQSPVVGSDETSIKVNGKKHWIHTYQTPAHTFIGHHPSRGIKAREQFYPDGLPRSILVSDCLAMQLSTPAIEHQLCTAHLLRELNAFEDAFPKCRWPIQFKKLLLRTIKLKEGPPDGKKIRTAEKDLEKLLKTNQINAPGKIPAFWKRMNKHSDKLFTFLYHQDVPADNNASERAIRNAKVKQKVSGQFKTTDGANRYAIIRSVIDTTIKQRQNVHKELSYIADLANQ